MDGQQYLNQITPTAQKDNGIVGIFKSKIGILLIAGVILTLAIIIIGSAMKPQTTTPADAKTQPSPLKTSSMSFLIPLALTKRICTPQPFVASLPRFLEFCQIQTNSLLIKSQPSSLTPQQVSPTISSPLINPTTQLSIAHYLPKSAALPMTAPLPAKWPWP